MRHQRGYTLIEVLIGIALVVIAVAVIGGAVIFGHFVVKYW